ncbi:uncharacterized protein LOC131217114 [Magnolia sinica]|uniref:uncharacterized protein LOC131217114 n=1 Tax=Magnolia sinica TaxID=86752 RepID=UPI002657B298|nr:uncharacterized protein LOC131217114 [Magnolia sinica]
MAFCLLKYMGRGAAQGHAERKPWFCLNKWGRRISAYAWKLWFTACYRPVQPSLLYYDMSHCAVPVVMSTPPTATWMRGGFLDSSTMCSHVKGTFTVGTTIRGIIYMVLKRHEIRSPGH